MNRQGNSRQFAGSHISRGGYQGRSNYQGDRGRGNSSRGAGGPPRAPTAPQVPPGSQIAGRSNAFEIKVEPNCMAYRYDVEITKVGEGQRKDKSLTKQNDPGLRTAQKECCADIIECLHNVTNRFGVGAHYVYDGKNTFYSTKEFPAINNQELTADLLKRRAAVFVRNSTVRISMTVNDSQPRINYSNLDTALVDNDARQADRSVRSFMEMVTTQFICSTDAYQRVAAGTVFETREAELADGMSMRIGVKKGVRVTEHTKQQPKAYLVADMKRTAFFSTGTIDQVYGRMVRGQYDRSLFNRFYKGVRMCVDYDPSRTFIFDCLTDRNVNDPVYRVNGRSLPDFFQQKRQITLRAANLPGAHPKKLDGQGCDTRVIFPLEVIRPVPGQLVPVEKLTDNAIRKLLLENAVTPDIRMRYIKQHVRQIAENDGATYLQNFGLTLRLNTNDVTIKTLPLPKIKVGADQVIHPQTNGSWFGDAVRCNFLQSTDRLKNWWVVYDRQVEPAQVRSFASALKNAGNRSGMMIPDPSVYYATNINELNDVFVEAKRKKVQFILYTDDLRIKSHGKLKLLEAYHKILTQHVVAKNLTAGAQTIKNILMKMNVKCFGVNYMPVFDESVKNLSPSCSDLLILGYDIQTPPVATAHERWELKQKNPTESHRWWAFVQIVSKTMDSPETSSINNAEMIWSRQINWKKAVHRATEAACQNGRRPTRVLVLRDGVSEGRQQNVLETELPAIRAGVLSGIKRTAETANLIPKITLVVATKEHIKRFFREQEPNQTLYNTCPGDVINGKVTRTDVPEFYVQAHHPLKGSPKIPQYAVVVNELGIPLQQLERAMIWLSNMHQVCACPTSLPLPVYLADETAKRGMEIFKAFEMSRHNGEGLLTEIAKNQFDMWDFKALTQLLGYHGSPLYGTRFNA
ncbi:hypothetical protein M3Y94_00194900 [Aphelenchoides besseyi]|nr:hypothetical protein M3Y94_00194900 [Aphelenchoides besseyi]